MNEYDVWFQGIIIDNIRASSLSDANTKANKLWSKSSKGTVVVCASDADEDVYQVAQKQSLVIPTVGLIDVLNNPEYRAKVDAIEDTLSSLRAYHNEEPTLERILKRQIAELKKASGYEYTVDFL